MIDKNLKLNNHFSLLTSHLSLQKGFTVIELLVVFTIIGILTAVGIASYSSYNNNQSLQNATSDVVNMLNTAKSRSISQVKPATCGTNPLTGYRVYFVNPQYILRVICGPSVFVIKTQDLPLGVTFAPASATSVTFGVSKGTSRQSTVTLNGFGKTENIVVSATGNILTN